MTLGRCPLSIFCSRGTPPRDYPKGEYIQDSEEVSSPPLARAADEAALGVEEDDFLLLYIYIYIYIYIYLYIYI